MNEAARKAAGVRAIHNPKNPIGKEGLPGKRHSEILQGLGSAAQHIASAENSLILFSQDLDKRLNRIQSTQRWMFATLIPLVILASLIATFMGLLILRLNG